MTLGEKQIGAANRTILLVGETGAGKSTLINALVNFTMGVTWEDDVWFQIVEETRGRSQSQSQTSDVTVYQIFGFGGKTLPCSLTIIDTPGYGDIGGIKAANSIKQQLLDLFRSADGVHEIHAVGLVLKATENRLTDRQRHVLDLALSPFGKDMEKNTVALLTHSDGLAPKNALKVLGDANVKCAKDERNQPVHFLFNSHQRDQRTGEQELALRAAWDLTDLQMRRFTEFLGRAAPRRPKATVEVLTEQIRAGRQQR
ncbi:uncharacterized protein [Brachionichthys hirsutus]|uniref:uncharacterized protein n=1 Tax=Brachionichthys hirsutus TaxID=412623 RepID=UPI0036045943